MVEFQKSGWSTGLNVRDYVKICLKEHQSTYLNWTKLLQKGGVIVRANWSEHKVICPKYYKISNKYCTFCLWAVLKNSTILLLRATFSYFHRQNKYKIRVSVLSYFLGVKVGNQVQIPEYIVRVYSTWYI